MTAPLARVRVWLAVVMALFAMAGVTLTTPAHALEQATGGHDAYATADEAGTKAQAAVAHDSAGKVSSAHGHVCAAHCAAHVMSAPPQADALGRPLHIASAWPADRAGAPRAQRQFGLDRPPRG